MCVEPPVQTRDFEFTVHTDTIEIRRRRRRRQEEERDRDLNHTVNNIVREEDFNIL